MSAPRGRSPARHWRLPLVLVSLLLGVPVVMAEQSPAVRAAVPAGFVQSDYASGFGDRLTSMSWSPDGRLFVSQKGGQLRVIRAGSLLAEPFATLPVDTLSERGLMGVAFDPDFATNRWLYVFYTHSPSLNNRISRLTASAANPDVVEAGSEVVLLEVPSGSSGMHNGGTLRFGPDGKLYVALGDASSGPNAQDMGVLPGKVLRLNRDGTVPADNPFVGQAGRRPEIWAIGMRNPFTFAFQPVTGRLFVNDVGNSSWEEINDVVRGANYGWPVCEGPCGVPSYVNPLHAYSHELDPGKAITGGVFYDGAAFPAEYANDYLFADYVGHYIKRYDVETGQVLDFATDVRWAVDLDVGPDGALYWLSVESKKVGRIAFGDPPPPTPTPTAPVVVGQPPLPQIDLPASGATYRAGDTISYSGQASDAEDGPLPATALAWEVDFHHDNHAHPFIARHSGVTSGSFTIPDTGETSANTWFRIHLYATDADGNVSEVTRDVHPLTARVTLDTSPSGLTVLLDGTPVITPYSFVGVQGARRQLDVVAEQSQAGSTYTFESWSDGQPQSHTWATPASDTTKVASFSASSGPLAADTFGRSVSGGWGSADVGGGYTHQGALSNFSVGSGSGSMVVGAGVTRSALLTTVSGRDLDISFSLRSDKRPAGGTYFVYAVARRINNSEYRPRLLLRPDGTIAAHASVVLNGTESPLGSPLAIPGLSLQAGSVIRFRAQLSGASPTTIRVRAWLDGTPEPTSWHYTTSASHAALQQAGSLGLRVYGNAGVTNAPLTFRFDDYLVNAEAPPPPPPTNPPVAAFHHRQLPDSLEVRFGDTSSGRPTSWLWDFGDGTTATTQNAVHHYAAPGTYLVRLVAGNAAGSAQHEGQVTVAAFDAAPAAPPGLAATTNGDQVQLTWSAPPGSDIAGYNVYRDGVPVAAPVVLAGAGDIADCATPDDEATAALLDAIGGWVFTLGDNAYEDGSALEFRDCYHPSWGQHWPRTFPVVGNHEYQTPAGAGYYGYFGAAAGDPDKGYYSLQLGSWQVLVLNSECGEVPGGCAAGSPQETWLRQQLLQSTHTCTLALWHKPVFASRTDTVSTAMRPMFDALQKGGVDLLLVGHAHHYERFAPQTVAGVRDTQTGLRQIIAGTGGRALHALSTPIANSEAYGAAHGVLKVTLNAASYDWQFMPKAGATFTDSGSSACHDTTGPLTTTGALNQAPLASLSFSDTISGAARHRYVVTAVDAAGRESIPSAPVWAGPDQPPPPPALVADTFTRSVSGGWGSAETGGSYTHQGTLSSFNVSGGSGAMVVAAGVTRSALLGGATARDVDISFSLRSDKRPSGGNYFVYAVARRAGNTEYRPRLRINPDGSVWAHASVVIDGAESPLGAFVQVPGLSHQAGSIIRFRAQVSGASPTTIRVRAWADGSPEPTVWHYTTSASHATLQQAGSLGLRVYGNRGVSNGPLTFRFDDYAVTLLQ